MNTLGKLNSSLKIFLLIFTLILSFSSCGKPDAVSSDTETEESVTSAVDSSESSAASVPSEAESSEAESSEVESSKVEENKTETVPAVSKPENKPDNPAVSTPPKPPTGKSPYYIRVNKQANCVTVFGKDANGAYTVPVKAMVCSTGPATPEGVFATTDKYEWGGLIHSLWGRYSVRFKGSFLFHSVPYTEERNPASLQSAEYNKLGTSASAGCVRLTVADAKWIYDNCPWKTTVEVYNSADPGPLGKPEAQKIPEDIRWDPTDVNENNPWNNKNAEQNQ